MAINVILSEYSVKIAAKMSKQKITKIAVNEIID